MTIPDLVEGVSKRPAPRKRPQPAARLQSVATDQRARDQDDVVDVAELARQNAALLERLDRLERGGLRTVESAPANLSAPRVADDEELTDWQRQVRQRTRPTPHNYGGDREPSYNVEQRWYMLPDGRVVQLQGDAKNLSYYIHKGYYLLDQAEAEHYVRVERPRILRIQQEKANLINTIRRAVQVDPALAAGLDPSWATDHDKMSVAELQDQLDEIANTPTSTGQKRRMMKRLPRLQDADDRVAEAETKRMLAGVETRPTRSVLDHVDAKVAERTRTIEVTRENAMQFR